MPGRLLTLYHHTSNAAAVAILHDRSLISPARVDLPFAFFSTHRDGRAAGPLHYGEAAVEVRVPEDLAQVDETFRDGEHFVKVALAELRREHFIRVHLHAGRAPAEAGRGLVTRPQASPSR